MKRKCVDCDFCYREDTISGKCYKTKETIVNIHEDRNCKLFRDRDSISTGEWQAAIDPHYGRRWE